MLSQNALTSKEILKKKEIHGQLIGTHLQKVWWYSYLLLALTAKEDCGRRLFLPRIK